MKAIIIGCGGAGANHANQLKKLNIEYDVYDTDIKKAECLASTHNVNVSEYKNHDLVIVCVPAVYHAKVVKEYIEKAVVCVEKPFTLKPVDSAYLERYKNLYCLESMVYSPPVLEAKNKLSDLGGKILWRANYSTIYRPQEWIDDIEIGGQTFLEGGVHIVSCARFLFGKAIRHTGFFTDENKRNGLINIEFEQGILNLTITWGIENCLNGKRPAVPNDSYLIGHQDYLSFSPFDDHGTMWTGILNNISDSTEPMFTNSMAADAVSSVWKCYQFKDIYTIV